MTRKRAPLPVGTRTCECPVCGERFIGFTGFEAHRRPAAVVVSGVSPCKGRKELAREGWSEDRQGRWSLPRKEEGRVQRQR
jgi:hypothetical protein